MAADNKTEKATPKKRQDERKKGNLFTSKDITSAASLIVIFIVLSIIFPYVYQFMSRLTERYFAYGGTITVLTTDITLEICKYAILAIFIIIAPVMLASTALSILATGTQTKFKITHKKLAFKFSRINIIEGFKRMFSLRSLVEVIKALIKMLVIIYVLYRQFKKIAGSVVELMYEDIMQATVFMLNSIMHIVLQLSIVFIAIAALDYMYQKWQYEKSIRMSKQDLKDEYKQLEGNPEVKGRMKEIQRKISMRRMMQQVPTADVIIKNPTHFAIALKYDAEKNEAPIVVAKGQDYVALKILELAEKNGIPTKEDKPLARALYGAVELNREIPPEFYAALAEIMAWIFTSGKKTQKK